MFKQLHLNITLAEALVLMPKYQKMLKALLSNKEKLQELANTPLNENCSAVIHKKLPEKLGDTEKFLIPCGFSELNINLMPLSVWKQLGLPDLIPTQMTLKLDNRAICTLDGIARDVFVPVGEDSDFKDSIDQSVLTHCDDLFVDPTPEMFIDEQSPNYSFPPRFDVYPDDFLEIEFKNAQEKDKIRSKLDKNEKLKHLMALQPQVKLLYLAMIELYLLFLECYALSLQLPQNKPLSYGHFRHETHQDAALLVLKPPNVNVVRSMWLFRHKYNADGSLSKYKALLVANGSTQQLGVNCDDTFSLVDKPTTIRTVMSLALSRNWPIHQLDVKNAFLNGDLSETVYMYQPPGFSDVHFPHHVCRLQRLLFGLKQARRAWFQWFAGYALQRIISSLHKEFDMSDFGALNCFLGIFVTRDSKGVFLSQKKYALQLLNRAHMTNYNPTRTLVDTESKLGSDRDPVSDPSLYHSLAGGLQYLKFTHPDISYVAGCPTTRHSTSGYCVFFGDNLLSWSSKRQRALFKSSVEAKYIGVSNVVAEMAWLRNLLRELHALLFFNTLVYCDNVSAIYLTANLVQHKGTKHIEMYIHFVRDMVALGQVKNMRHASTGPSLPTHETISAGNAPDKSLYANVTGKSSRTKVNFHTLFTPRGNGIDVVVPIESIRAISERFVNTAYGFFLGKRLAYSVVANYVRNTWGKFRLIQSTFSSFTGLFSFQFSSMEGLNAMLENGPWFIRNNPLILKKWHPYVNLMKEDVGTILVWVKIHGVPVIAFNEDGLSDISTKLGTPLMLNSYMSDMCMQSWSRSSYTRAMIELRADVELKDNIIVAMPKITREGHYTCNIRVEYEWKPPRCAYCNVFGHIQGDCPKNIGAEYPGDHDSEDEVALVDNDMACSLTLERTRFGTQFLLEKWRNSYGNGDYDEDPYDDDMYEGHDLSEEIQTICDKDLDLRRKEEKLLIYNTLFLGEYEYSSFALDGRMKTIRLDYLKQDLTMLVIKIFSERKKAFRERNTIENSVQRGVFLAENSAAFIARKSQRLLVAVLAVSDISEGRLADNTQIKYIFRSVIMEQQVVSEPQGGSYAAIAPKLELEKFKKWKKRRLCYLAGMEPYYLKCIKDGPFQPKTADGDAKPESQWTTSALKASLCHAYQITLPEKWLTFSQGLRNANHTQTLDLADIYERFVYEDNLIQRRYSDTKKALITTPSSTTISTAFFSNNVIHDFQEKSDDEVDERSSEEYLRDLDIEYQERALLTNSKCSIKRRNNFSGQKAIENTECFKCGNKGQANLKFQKDYKAEYKKTKAKFALLEASPSSSQNSNTFQPKNKADDELIVGKSHAHNDERVDIIIRKVNTLLFMDDDADWQTYLKYINIDLKSVEEQRLNLLSKYNKMKKVLGGELFTDSSSKMNDNENLFVPASIRYDQEIVPKTKDWVERLNLDRKLLNFNTRRILVPESQVVNESFKSTEILNTLESSKDSEAESLTLLPPLKNLQGASPSSEVMPLTFQPHSPKERPGLGIMKHTKPETQDSSNKSVLGTVTISETKQTTPSVPTEVKDTKQE
nr:hypothetical protein [Tanacetum cinerariifolium]